MHIVSIKPEDAVSSIGPEKFTGTITRARTKLFDYGGKVDPPALTLYIEYKPDDGETFTDYLWWVGSEHFLPSIDGKTAINPGDMQSEGCFVGAIGEKEALPTGCPAFRYLAALEKHGVEIPASGDVSILEGTHGQFELVAEKVKAGKPPRSIRLMTRLDESPPAAESANSGGGEKPSAVADKVSATLLAALATADGGSLNPAAILQAVMAEFKGQPQDMGAAIQLVGNADYMDSQPWKRDSSGSISLE